MSVVGDPVRLLSRSSVSMIPSPMLDHRLSTDATLKRKISSSLYSLNSPFMRRARLSLLNPRTQSVPPNFRVNINYDELLSAFRYHYTALPISINAEESPVIMKDLYKTLQEMPEPIIAPDGENYISPEFLSFISLSLERWCSAESIFVYIMNIITT